MELISNSTTRCHRCKACTEIFTSVFLLIPFHFLFLRSFSQLLLITACCLFFTRIQHTISSKISNATTAAMLFVWCVALLHLFHFDVWIFLSFLINISILFYFFFTSPQACVCESAKESE